MINCKKLYSNLIKINSFYYSLLAFILLVSFGITGSSLGWYKQYPGANGVMELTGEKKLVGAYRGIRGDEFIAHGTPNALAQCTGNTNFSKINTHLGLGGRNELMFHDLGAPVANPSIIGRPATWGFFILDLRRALSWYWWFPVFFFIWGFQWLLEGLFPGQTRWNWILSITAALAPISAGWSFWPANNAAGACLAAAAFLRLVKTKDWRFQALYSLSIGWGISCSALSLYFPRFYTISLLLGVVAAMELTRQNQWKNLLNIRRATWIILSLVIFGLILGTFIYSVKDEWIAVQNSVYPGRRRDYGGSFSWWMLMKGWLAPLTIYKVNYLNQCELQGEFSLLFPLFIYFCIFFKELRRNLIFCGIGILFLFLLIYQYIGLPQIIALPTLLSFCTPPRCAMALSMGQIILVAMLLARFGKRKNNRDQILVHAGLALLCLLSGGLLLVTAPNELWRGLLDFYPVWFIAGVLVFIGAVYTACCFLLLNNSKWFVLLFAAINILPGIVFNPICIAPRRIEYKLSEMIDRTPNLKYSGKILWATDNNYLAVVCYFSGGHTLNGYFMYYDQELFDLLFRDQPDAEQFKRMTHLDVQIVKGNAVPYKPLVTHNDRILLRFNGKTYDFSKLPIDFLATFPKWKTTLSENPSLKYYHTADGIDYYRVINAD